MVEKKQSFSSLGVPKVYVEKLKHSNIQIPTEVQSATIPLIMQGKDLIGQSPTGTGKTLAYLLPVLAKLDAENKLIQALILAPTKELAMQIAKLAAELGEDQNLLTVPILGGTNLNRQVDTLKKKPQLVVGTPGRILELIRKRKINCQGVKTVVIDEGDKMFQMGFKEDVQAIIKSTLRERQVIMVSATVAPEVVTASMKFLYQPELVNISQGTAIASTIQHQFFMTQERNKAQTLHKLLRIYKPKKAIIFINSNKGVLPFTKRFQELGYQAEGLHSELNQQARKAVIEKFRGDKTQLLVTTDLFARGMDVRDVGIVFNFDLPINTQHYIHRVGRTGRAGKTGLAINLVTPDQKFIMPKYARQLKIHIQEMGLADNKVVTVNKELRQNSRPRIVPIKRNNDKTSRD